MPKLARALVAMAAIGIAGGSLAFAASPSVVIDGRTYGPREGLEVETLSFDVRPGAGTIVALFQGPTADSINYDWGASYAHSTETLFVFYDGSAKAAANIYASKRIIQVCIWYERAGDGVVGPKRCSNADGNTGVWRPGIQVRTDATDSLGLEDPVTQFKVTTYRISPGILP